MNQKAYELLREIPEGSHFIDGEWVKSGASEFEVFNPANGEKLFTCADGSVGDVDRAVKIARAAFESGPWSQMDAAERGRLLQKVATRIEELKDSLCFVESLHNGKTVKEAGRGDLPPSADIYRYYAGWADKFHGETIPVSGPYLNYTLREPLGVVGAIVPWNYPLLIACWKVAPALAMGNTVVLKPSSQTPLTALMLANIMAEVGIPKGVFNVVTGRGKTGEFIARHNDVDKVAFTGSTDVGKKIVGFSAESNLKRVSLELGGKSPQVIFPDADLEAALDPVLWGIYANKGEVCSAGSRLYLHESIYESFVKVLVERIKTMKVGDPQGQSSDIGSLVSQSQMNTVLNYIKKGQAEGAKLAFGGARLTDGELSKGFYIEPTLFTNVTNEMTIAKEEIFGPVLCVIPFKSEDEVIRLCNDSPYGLVSSVWTKDSARSHRMARKIKAGSVWINCYNGFDSASPFGGFKQSGWGREMGIHALESYTQVKSIWVDLK